MRSPLIYTTVLMLIMACNNKRVITGKWQEVEATVAGNTVKKSAYYWLFENDSVYYIFQGIFKNKAVPVDTIMRLDSFKYQYTDTMLYTMHANGYGTFIDTYKVHRKGDKMIIECLNCFLGAKFTFIKEGGIEAVRNIRDRIELKVLKDR